MIEKIEGQINREIEFKKVLELESERRLVPPVELRQPVQGNAQRFGVGASSR